MRVDNGVLIVDRPSKLPKEQLLDVFLEVSKQVDRYLAYQHLIEFRPKLQVFELCQVLQAIGPWKVGDMPFRIEINMKESYIREVDSFDIEIKRLPMRLEHPHVEKIIAQRTKR